MPAGRGKGQSVDRAIAADARQAAEQRVARHLPGHSAPVGLQDHPVPRHLREVIAIGKALFHDPDRIRRDPEGLKDFAATLRLLIEESDRFAQTGREDERGEMVARRSVPFPGAEKNSAAFA